MDAEHHQGSLKERLLHRIREAPGTHLAQAALAAAERVHESEVKSALYALQKQGHVTFVERAGAVVDVALTRRGVMASVAPDTAAERVMRPPLDEVAGVQMQHTLSPR